MVALQESERVCYLDELFMALLGHTGDIFQRREEDTHVPGSVPNPSQCSFQTAENVYFVSESDRIILDGLLRLGFHCYSLKAFVRLEEFAWSRKGFSHYRCALSHGVSELLEVYSSAILKLQSHLDDVQFPSLSTIRYFLSEFTVLLPSIHEIIYQVQISGLRGAQVLQILHEKADSGDSEVQSCVKRLSWHCQQIFYKHLRGWIQHGLLLDKTGEFFVQENGWDEGLKQNLTGGASHAKEWHSRFQVVTDFIPPEVSEETANSILLLGKAVRALRPESDRLSQNSLDDYSFLDSFESSESFNGRLFEHCIEQSKRKAAEKLWDLISREGDLMNHLRALRDYFLMGRGDFWHDFLLESHSLMSLPAIPATALANISAPFQQSASMTSAESDPLFPQFSLSFYQQELQGPKYLGGAKSVPLTSDRSNQTETPYMSMGTVGTSKLGQDSASTQYFSARESIEARPPGPTKKLDTVNTVSLNRGMEGKVGGKNLGIKVPDYDPAWDPLTLEYDIKWPLHLILSPEVVMKYSRMFQYLIRLERMQLELKRCWSTMNEIKSRKHIQGQSSVEVEIPKGMPSMWQIRTHMAHLISNLQLYIQVDVIEVQYEEMASKMKSVKTLQEAEQTLEDFLSACVIQSCLDVPMFSSLLSKTLAFCRTFCSLIQVSRSQSNVPEYPTALVEDFQRNSRLLFRLLSTPAMQGRARAPYLRLLLLRLNFNNFLQEDTERYKLAQAPAPVHA